MSPDIKAISVAVKRYIDIRDSQRAALEDLRRIAVEQCGFDQGMVLKCNSVVDLLDGFVKGALAASAPDLDGWIDWAGGECPVPDDTLVQCKLRDGDGFHMCTRKAKKWAWMHDEKFNKYDLVAYRVVNEGGAP